jgi:hypothetical protein
MEARIVRAVIIAAVLLVSMGARHRSANFIVDTPDPVFCRQVSQAAEKYRRDLAVSWLGKAMPDWSAPCMLTVREGKHLGSGGATTFVFDRGEVFGWRMTIQGSRERILDSVLPHEITHMIFASRFRQPLPRWADEGGATSVEHVSERNKYRRMLYKFLQTGRGIAFNRMFAMRDYPRDVMPLYAQGYSVAEFLIQQHGRRKYIEFVDAGLKTRNWPGALRSTYGIADASALQKTWLAWVQQGSPSLAPGRQHPAAAPAGEILASAERLPRPEPNLLHHVPAEARPLASAATNPPRPSSPVRLASAHAAAAKQLPASGWHVAGTSTPAAGPAASQTVAPAVHAQTARPQPVERSRQIILEWGR